MTGVANLERKRKALAIAARLVKQAGASLSPATHKDGVSEARRIALDLESIEPDLDTLDAIKRRQQPAGALR